MRRTQHFFRLTRALPNSVYDRRCKYGLGAHAEFREGMLWMKLVPGDEMLADELSPEMAGDEQFREELRARRTLYSTPLGNVLNWDDQRALEEASQPTEAQSVRELLYIHGMQSCDAEEVLRHLMKAHDWTLAEVERVVVGVANAPAEDV